MCKKPILIALVATIGLPCTCDMALQAASYEGHEKMVQMLLDAGADLNAQGGEYGNALRAASLDGHEKVVQILLKARSQPGVKGHFLGCK